MLVNIVDVDGDGVVVYYVDGVGVVVICCRCMLC